ncbi:MAG TPA: hypothetical protein VK422_18895 [Pyrinomonadaceae bacterium]|nr:hypothetical protein [Pyrinomonadaceae bacterium]
MSDYATVEELLGYLPGVTSEEDQGVLASMLTRGSRAIDSFTRRPDNAFAPAPSGSAERVIYGEGSAVLRLPEFVEGSVEGVAAPTGYVPAGYVEFRRAGVVGLHTATPEGILTARVEWAKGVPYRVTARWGYAETPGAVKEALLQLVVRWWRTKDEAFAGVVGQIGTDRTVWERGFPSGVKTLLAPYVLEEALEDEAAGTIERGELLDADTNPGGGWR